MNNSRNRGARNGLVTYMWLSGHIRNVGDSMLRRPYAEVARRSGPIKVWSAAPGSGYELGLQLLPGEASNSFLSWYLSFAKNVLLGKPRFAFNAGEFGVTKSYFAGMVCLLPWLLLLHLKKGHIIWVGASVRGRRTGFTWPFKAFVMLCTQVYWRDIESPIRTRTGELAPDWAFSLLSGGKLTGVAKHQINTKERSYLAVALRGDRSHPRDEWLSAVVQASRRLNLILIFVAQVQDDDELANRLAQQFHAEVCRWDHDNHYDQEMAVRAVYRESVLIISDRLHGLIMGATEGAIPLGWTERDPTKIRIHMSVIGADWVYLNSTAEAIDSIEKLSTEDIAPLANNTISMTEQARERVHAVIDQLGTELK